MKAIVKNAMAFLFVFMVNELKDILERLHKVFWNNRNSKYRDTLMPVSFACNLIYLVITEIEGKEGTI